MTTKTTLVAVVSIRALYDVRAPRGSRRCRSCRRLRRLGTGAAADDDFVHAPDARLVIAAGEGDFTRARGIWTERLGIAGPGFALGTHAGSVVAAAADPRPAGSCSPRPRRARRSCGTCARAAAARRPLTTGANQNRASAATSRALRVRRAVTAATVRGGRLAFGFANGGVAAADARRGCNSVAYGGGGGLVATGASVVWSDLVHSGHECRSVDIAPSGDSRLCARLAFDSPFLILTGGFDGRLALRGRGDRGARRVALASRRRARGQSHGGAIPTPAGPDLPAA